MAEDEVGSLAEELQLLAAALGTQDHDAPDSVVGRIRQYVEGAVRAPREAADVQRIGLT